MLIQPEPGLAIWTVVTFLLLVFVLGKFAWKPIMAMLQERESTIRQALDEAMPALSRAGLAESLTASRNLTGKQLISAIHADLEKLERTR